MEKKFMFSKNAKMIWYQDALEQDEYIDFAGFFVGKKGKSYHLDIFCDSDYTLWVNGELAAFGQYPCFPDYKVYDTVDISRHIRDGKNTLCILVWYYGFDSMTYIRDEAGLVFTLSADDEEVLSSSEKILCRPDRGYIRGRAIPITTQLGLRYGFDNAQEDNWYQKTEFSDFVPAIENPLPGCGFTKRPIQKTVLKDRIFGTCSLCGSFFYENPDAPAADRMQNAALTLSKQMMQEADGVRSFSSGQEGIWFIVDLGAETCGFLDLDFEVPKACRVDIGFGEHILDGRCRTRIDARDFSIDFYAKAGRNQFLNTFRRLGCRYIQVFAETTEIKVYYAGIRPVEYPLAVKQYQSGNPLRDAIYAVCENTLIHCMHEHYEDCPWREQALYTMDSRNQMLCGYYCFSEYEFARASLYLIAKSQRPDGLLAICSPAGTEDVPIPCFSLAYLIQMQEYIDYSGDTSLAKECFGVLKTILKTFTERMGKNGLAERFYDPEKRTNYWNFYEWSPTMIGQFYTETPDTEAPMNAFLSLALGAMANICNAIGEDSSEYIRMRQELNDNIYKYFYCEKDKLFFSFQGRDREQYSVLTQALCLLCGAAEQADKSVMLRVLSENGSGDYGVTMVPNTLSMNCYRFDALLLEDKEKYAPLILKELDETYLYMLRQGATSFWETVNFANGDAESLCHGWSALPIYYYETLIDNR